MTVLECDRCGKKYNFFEKSDKESKIETTISYVNEDNEILDDLDLCPDCKESFNCWLTNPDFDSDEDEVNEEDDAKAEDYVAQWESSLKDTYVSMYDVWGMVADMIISCTENINKMDKERKRNG